MQISTTEIAIRVEKLKSEMKATDCKSLLLRSIPAQLYLTGSVFDGFTYIHLDLEYPVYFPIRPTNSLNGMIPSMVHPIRKPEAIPEILKEAFGKEIDENMAVELSYLPVQEYQRLQKLSSSGKLSPADASQVLRTARMIKTDDELKAIRQNAALHCEMVRLMPELYSPGMTDLQWQHEIEYQMRKRGSIGVFRAFGARMEVFMGNILTGDNGGAPSPYDFSLGGAGVPSMPFGANGTTIRSGMTAMVDMAGNYGAYQTDITRTFSLGKISPLAQSAHDCSVEMHEWLQANVKAGTPISDPYNFCIQLVEERGLTEYFMGTEFQSKFVGHGLGIEINEMPVLTAKAKGVFEANMVIAFEPKFVIPGVGPVGAENTYIITDTGIECITPLPMGIIPLPEA